MNDSASGYDSVSKDFLVLIGRIVIKWGRVERIVDIAVASGKALIPNHFKKGPPIALKSKMKAFRELCNAVPENRSNLVWLDKRIDEFLKLAESRHTIVHGFLHLAFQVNKIRKSISDARRCFQVNRVTGC
jgi:hypothetical protein